MDRKISVITLINNDNIIGGKIALKQCIESVHRNRSAIDEHLVVIEDDISQEIESVLVVYRKRKWIKCLYIEQEESVETISKYAQNELVLFLMPNEAMLEDSASKIIKIVEADKNIYPTTVKVTDRYGVGLSQKNVDVDLLSGTICKRGYCNSVDKISERRCKLEIVSTRIDKKAEISELENNVPLITVVTVVRNAIGSGRESTLVQCLKSVHNQSYKNIEHLVIDGESTDGTYQMLCDVKEELGFKLITERDTDVWDAMRKGMQLAKGEFVNFLNSDDFFSSDESVEIAVKKIVDEKADYFYSEAFRLPENAEYNEKNLEKSYFGNPITVAFGKGLCHQSMYVRTDVMRQLDTFNSGYKISLDNYLMLQLELAGCKHACCDKELVTFRMGGISAFENFDMTQNVFGEYFYDSVGKSWGMSLEECKAIWILRCQNDMDVKTNLTILKKIGREEWRTYFIEEYIKVCQNKMFSQNMNEAYSDIVREKDARIRKFKDYFDVLNMWMKKKNSGRKIEQFFEKNKYKDIAIYGAGELGTRLMEELGGSNVCIKYIIDQKKKAGIVPTFTSDEILPEVDIIIVTPLFAYASIKEKLAAKFSCPIISLTEVVNEI